MAAERRDSIRIRVENKDYDVVGGAFQQLLAAVKALPQRRFNGRLKLWEVGGSLAMAKGQLENSGFQLEGGTPAPESEQAAAPANDDRIKLQVGGHVLVLTGAPFRQMLDVVKGIPGRRFNGDHKLWLLPGSLAEHNRYFEEQGMRLERTNEPPPEPVADSPPAEGSLPFDEPDESSAIPTPPPPPPEEAGFADFFDDPAFEDYGFEEPEEADQPIPDQEPPPAPPSPSPANPPQATRPASAQTGRRDQIRVVVENRPLVVVGGAFRAMLDAVKAIPGRRFDGQTKQWLLPADMESVQQHLKAKGFHLEEE